MNEAQKVEILKKLAQCMQTYPGLRVSQLISNALNSYGYDHSGLFYLPDDILLKAVSNYLNNNNNDDGETSTMVYDDDDPDFL